VTDAAADLEQIRQLLARYCFAIDARDGPAWADLFTDDGVFHYALGEPLTGREALVGFVAMVPDDRHHLTMNEIIEIDGDEATVRAYALVTRGTPPIISAVGEYADALRRTSAGWKFATRVYTPHQNA
jgi:ketosteroid isomerase-like protein